ncbi:cytochrome c-type biogenesis protein CcmH [Vibrio amylolyticus]|uniref:cytochrome c-type biogenesis protein CcmH n=1 Tax=Vibrio amylolyticus TaxID=2847292 RepID=UPI0035535EF3
MKAHVIFLLSVCSSFSLAYAQTDGIFIAPTKEATELVELFEFKTAEYQKTAVSLAKSLRCPQCQNQNLVESNSPIAKDLRFIVFTKINQGESEEQVIEFMTSRYGEFVLYNPPKTLKNALLWGLPLLVMLLFALFSYRSISNHSTDEKHHE